MNWYPIFLKKLSFSLNTLIVYLDFLVVRFPTDDESFYGKKLIGKNLFLGVEISLK